MDDDRAIEEERLERAIAAQEGLRGVVPDEIVDASIAALRRQLEHSRPDAQRRRQVTVVFADVSGFTSMSSRLDAELVAGLMNELWSRLDTVVVDHGGRIDKHIGDAVMAVWGATSTQEDDAERAVRAALAMQEELARPGHDHQLSMRVGINTGPAHLGTVGASREFTAMGDTVNVASRIQQVAPLGGVLVTHDTYRHIRGIFDVEAIEPVRVKGKSDPIRTYVVRRAKSTAFRMPTRGVEGVETRTIGRADELATLRAEFERVVERAAVRRVTVIGDAGVGKSRLLYEFESWIDLQPTAAYFFKGRAVAIRRSASFGLVRDVFTDRFGVLDSDPTSAVTAKVRRGLAPPLDHDEADLVGHWLGFDLRSSRSVQRLLGSGQLAPAARAHLFHWLRSLASGGPVVMFLEDLHWADDESLVLLDEIVDHCRDVPLLIVGVARPDLLERPNAATLLEPPSTVQHLMPLGAEATRGLVGEVLQKVGEVPDALTDLIVERADGNAFYVEELVKMLIDDGVVETGEPLDAWRVHLDRLDPEGVPATLTGVLQSRLDSLAPAERDALQRSSVVGRVFWDGTVASLGHDRIEAIATLLASARDRELIFRHERSSFDDNVEYAFKHALLRDVTYETVLLRDRQRLHGLVARWLADHAGEREVEYAALIATHHRLGGELGAAAELLRRAAVASLDSGNSAAARRTLQEALELWRMAGEEPPVDALISMADAALRLGDIDIAHRHAGEALRRVETPEQRVAALFLASWAASEKGERDRERALLDEALPDAERQGGVPLAHVLAGLAWTEIVRGDAAAAAAYVERVSVVAEQLGDPNVSRDTLNLLAILANMHGDHDAALRHVSDALAVAVEAGDLEGQALAQANIGVTHHLRGDELGSTDEYHAALHHYEQAKALNSRLGRLLQEGLGDANIGQIYTRLGDDALARRRIHAALNKVRGAGGTALILFCVLAEADRRMVNGETSTALELIGLVQQHPAVTKDNADDIDRILSRAGLPADVVEDGLARGAGHDLDVVVDRLVRELRDVIPEGSQP